MLKSLPLLLSFWAMTSSALIGGTAVLKSDPMSKSVIALQMVEKQSDGTLHFYKGSGVLISRNVILTAAHNFFYLADVTQSQAILSTVPNWGADSLGQKRIFVKSVSVFPGFSQSSLGTQNDLALVFLTKKTPQNYVPLNVELDGAGSPVLNENGILFGFGRSSEDTSAPLSDYRLRSLELKFARWDNHSIFDSQKIWFSNQNGSIAGGDSGGPVLFMTPTGLKVFGIGIHHRYDPCVKSGRCESQSAYSNTTFFAEWLKDKLK